MIRKNQRLINGLNLLSDLVLIFFSYFAALFTKFFLIERHNGTLVWFSESLYWGVALAYSALLVVVYYFAVRGVVGVLTFCAGWADFTDDYCQEADRENYAR